VVVQRSEYPCRDRGWAAAIDELENGVEVDAAVARQPSGQIGSEPGGNQASAAPPDDRAELRAPLV
jgi:hypothetical protein